MSSYIETEKLNQWFNDRCMEFSDKDKPFLVEEYGEVQNDINSSLSQLIDENTVQIVRCKDCKHIIECERSTTNRPKNMMWFCPNGEKRSDTGYGMKKRSPTVNEPTADVVEVKHGQWVLGSDTLFVKCIPECTHCGKRCYPAMLDKYRYCPYCGARMDGEADGS